MRLYFAHSQSDKLACRDAQLKIEDELGVEIFNPYFNDSTIPFRNQLHNADSKNYVARVTYCLNKCDGVLAMPDSDDREIAFVVMLGKAMGKKIYTITEKYRDCPWFQVYSDCIFDRIEAFVAMADRLRS